MASQEGIKVEDESVSAEEANGTLEELEEEEQEQQKTDEREVQS